MSGSDATGRWYITLKPAGDEYLLYGDGYVQDSTAIFENGLRLRLAAGFTLAPGADASFRGVGSNIFRLNSDGAVVGVN